MARTPAKGKTAAPKADATAAPALPRNEAGNIAVPRFGWNTSGAGLAAKAVLVMLADEGKTLPKGSPAKVRELVPQLAAAYQAGTVTERCPKGRTLTDGMITGRHQYMWFTAARNGQEAIKGQLSREHPLHELCNARFAAVYPLVKARGIAKPFTDAELAKYGEVAAQAAGKGADDDAKAA